MDTARYISTDEAARLTGEAVQTVQRKALDSTYIAISQEAGRGRGGKSYLVDVTSLPREAQLRRIMMNEGYKLEGADLIGYREKYGEEGLKQLIDRRTAVIECQAIETDGKGNVTCRKNAVAARCGVTPRTLYRWCKGYAESGTAGLMDTVNQSNKGKPRGLCMCAQDIAMSYLMKDVKRTNRAVYERLLKAQRKAGMEMCTHQCVHCPDSLARREIALAGKASEYEICDRPGTGIEVSSYSAFNRWVSQLPKDQLAYARHGNKYWEAHYMPKASREKPTMLNKCWFGDHHQLDCWCIDDDGCLVRPWMTVWSDAATGCLIGWCLSTNPNSATIAETFARAVLRKLNSPFFGLPKMVYIDNGRDYRGKRFEGDVLREYVIGRLNENIEKTGMLETLGVGVTHAMPYRGWPRQDFDHQMAGKNTARAGDPRVPYRAFWQRRCAH